MAPFRVLSNLFGGNNSITMRNGHMTENTGNRSALGDGRDGTQKGPDARESIRPLLSGDQAAITRPMAPAGAPRSAGRCT